MEQTHALAVLADDLPESSPTTTWCTADLATSIMGEDFPDRARELAATSAVSRFPGGLLVAGVDAAAEVMRDPATYSSRPDAFFLGSAGGLIPIQVDPPEHTRYRRLLDQHFSPRTMEGLRDTVTSATREHILSFLSNGRCDIVRDLGAPVPAATILALLGFSMDRLDELLAVKNAILHSGAAETSAEAKMEAALGAYGFFESVLLEREEDPQEDMATFLVGLEREGEISRQESLDICLMLVIAGLDTVTATMANMFYLLAQRPDLQRRIAADPSVVPSAVEEFLRFVSPVPYTPRVCTQDTVLAGCPVSKGDRLTVLFTTANWDDATYESPLQIDLDRSPNRHTAFGLGRHRCLGSHLARMELQVILGEWHALIPEYRLPADYQPMWRRGIREISSVPIEFG